MRISVVSFKGGVGKTTTAVHVAAYLQRRSPTLLIDGDPNRSATDWQRRGGLPFAVEDERRAARHGSARNYEYVVIDTEARPAIDDLRAIAEDSDLLILPTTPDALALAALMHTVETLSGIGADRFKILLTAIPPKPSNDGEEARAMLKARGLPTFKGEIRRRVAFQKAALAGVPVYQVNDPRAAEAWSDYESVGRETVK
jgi:chromosome partitioning protein